MHNGNIEEKIFHYVIISSGFYSKRCSPVKNIELFQGTVLHSADYRDPSIFQNKKVLIIGNGISSGDICIESLNIASEITQIFRSKYLIVTKIINNLPYEAFTNNLKNISNANLFKVDDEPKYVTKAAFDFFGNPGKFHEKLRVEDESGLRGYILIDDEYPNALSDNKINLIEGTATEFYSDGVILNNGEQIQADVIIIATGFCRDLNFLGKKLKKIIEYEDRSYSAGMTLFRSILHPDIPRLVFIANSRGSVPCRFEMCARIGMKWLLGTLNISYDTLQQEIQNERILREKMKNSQSLYPLSALLGEFLSILDINLDLDFLENEFKFKNSFFIAQFIDLNIPEVKEDARKVIKEIQKKYNGFCVE